MDGAGGQEDVDARLLGVAAAASQARSMSSSLQRARPQMIGPWTCRAIACTASKSPGEAMGKPASMTSTPRSCRAWAISSFSARFMLAPGDCSPSRSVVSKMIRRSSDIVQAPFGVTPRDLLEASGPRAIQRAANEKALGLRGPRAGVCKLGWLPMTVRLGRFPPQGECKVQKQAQPIGHCTQPLGTVLLM